MYQFWTEQNREKGCGMNRDTMLSNGEGAPRKGEDRTLQLADPGWNSATWTGAQPVAPPPKSWIDRCRGVLRLSVFALATVVLLPVFFVERARGGGRDRRIAGLWCWIGLKACGLSVRQVGAPMTTGGALLANHASWIDIVAIGSIAPVHFVAKAEVAGWPLFGWIGKISNTVFIERRRTEAKAQEAMLARRARDGDLLCIFPEGTSTDGQRVLPFKSSLFSVFFAGESGQDAPLAQPLSVHYGPPAGLARSFYGWWGTMPLVGHIWNVACLSRGGVVAAVFHPPIDAADFADRKSMAAAAQHSVAAGLSASAAAHEQQTQPEAAR